MSAECTSFILDVSTEMLTSGKLASLLPYIEHTLLNKLERGRKTDWTNIYLVNHAETRNTLDVSNAYELLEMTSALTASTVIETMKALYALTAENTISQVIKSEPGDDTERENIPASVIEQCLLVSTYGIQQQFRGRKMLRQVVCFTDDMHSLNMSEEEVAVMLGEFPGRFILVDCRGSEHKGESDTYIGSGWERLIQAPERDSLVEPLSAMLSAVEEPHAPTVRPVRIFAGQLRLGADLTHTQSDGELENEAFAEDTTTLCINVEGFPATKPVSSLHRKQVLKDSAGQVLVKQGKSVAPKSVVEYEIRRPRAPGTEGTPEQEYDAVPVPSNAVTKAYRFGADYVILPSTLAADIARPHTTAGLDIRGFLPEQSLPRPYLCSETTFVLADTRLGSMGDIAAFSALVDGMRARHSAAVARYVARDGAEVQMCALVPLRVSTAGFTPPYEDSKGASRRGLAALALTRLPFAEDQRVYTGRGAGAGAGAVEEKCTPVRTPVDTLMSQFVDSMDMDTDTDTLPDTPREEYYPQYTADGTATTLPLPHPNSTNSADPLLSLAVTPHRQKQVMYDYIHKVLIGGQTAEFEPPSLPPSIRTKIQPVHSKQWQASTVEALVQKLGVREVPTTQAQAQARGTAQADAQDKNDATQAAPPLDDLLALGRRQ